MAQADIIMARRALPLALGTSSLLGNDNFGTPAAGRCLQQGVPRLT